MDNKWFVIMVDAETRDVTLGSRTEIFYSYKTATTRAAELTREGFPSTEIYIAQSIMVYT